jgi:ATP-dependent Clp protease ATP-binding subunit ClpA
MWALRRVGYSQKKSAASPIRCAFDEMEKAHPDLANLMLQIFEDGFLTDAQGHKSELSQTPSLS